MTSEAIFSAISFVSLRNKLKGVPTNVRVQRGVKAQTNDVTAPPKKITPTAEATSATIFAKTASTSFGAGIKDFRMVINFGPTGATSVCFKVGIKNPSKA